MSKVRRRTVGYGVIGLVVVGLLVFAFIPDPIPVETAPVARGPMRVTIDSRGITRVRDRYTLVAPVTGRLERIELREGDPVRAGDLIARIASPPADPRQAREIDARVDAAGAAQREAEAVVGRTAAGLDLARKEAARIERLAREGVASREQLDRARTAEAEARKQLDAARASASAAASHVEAERASLLALDRSGGPTLDVRAPVSGRVFDVPDRSARMLQAGEPIVVLGDARHLELVIDVLSEDAVKIRPGHAVVIEEWGGSPPLRGRVRLVEPSAYTKISALGIEEQRVDVIADLDDIPPQIGDGYRVEARVVIWQSPAALTVPVSALFRASEAWTVFVAEDGRAHRRTVQVAHRNDSEAEVLSGLREGERVLVHPADDIADGTRVR